MQLSPAWDPCSSSAGTEEGKGNMTTKKIVDRVLLKDPPGAGELFGALASPGLPNDPPTSEKWNL